MDAKESIRRELPFIIRMDNKADYGNKKFVDDVLSYMDKNQLNQSPYGKNYQNKLNEIRNAQADALPSFTCLICTKESGKKMICPACSEKLSNLVQTPQKREPVQAGSEKQTTTADISNKIGNVKNSVSSAISSGMKSVVSSDGEENIRKTARAVSEGTKKGVDKLTERVNVMLGGEGSVDLRLRDLFSQVLKKHSKDEADELFICGTKYTTPEPDKISTSWPKPWLFSRVALILIATFLVLLIIYNVFQNEKVIPDIIFVGSLAIPFSMLVLLFEINAPRNISIFRVIVVFMLGGAASLFVTLFLFEFNPSVSFSVTGAIAIGIIEELGKIIILAYTINRLQTTKYILNGMLIGGAVGAGFAVFESAGYAFNAYLANYTVGLFFYQSDSPVDNMVTNIILRGFLSPGGHIAWAAMEGAFLIIVLSGKPFKWSVVFSPRYLTMCILPVAMHAFWDMDFLSSLRIGMVSIKLVALILVALIVLLVILNRGLAQINSIQTQKPESEAIG